MYIPFGASSPALPGANLPAQSSSSNDWRSWLPTITGIAGGVGGAFVPVGGETGVTEMGGMSIGQGLGKIGENYLEGNPDVTKGAFEQTGMGLLAGMLGLGAGNLAGKYLTGSGADLATGGLNLTKSQLAKYEAQFGEPLAKTLIDNNLAGVDTEGLQNGIDTLDEQYGNLAKQQIPVDQTQFLKNVAGAKQDLLGNSNVIPSSAQKATDALDQELQNKVYPQIGINVGKDGSIAIDSSKAPTLADLQNIKQSYASQTTPSQWSTDPNLYGVNRLIGNIVRKTMNDTAPLAGNGATLKGMGVDLMMLKNAVEKAAGRSGVGADANPLSWGNEVLGEGGIAAAAGLGLNPLTGLLLPGARIAGSLIKGNSAIAGSLSRLLTGASGAINSPMGASLIGGASSLAGGNLYSILNPTVSSLKNPLESGEQGQANQYNQSDNHNYPNIAQNSSNVNTTRLNQDTGQTMQAPTGNQAQWDEQGHLQLPDLNSVQTTIPGQVYPPELQAQDIQKVSNLPFYMQDAAMNQIRTKATLNDQIVNQYMANHALNTDQANMMKQIPPTIDQMNYLQDLVKTNTGSNLLQAVVNDNPAIQYLKSHQNTPESAQYATMLNLMSTLRSASEYAQVHGRLSNFDIQNLNNLPTPGDTTTSALAKIKLAMSTLADQYERNLPAYGYSLLQGQQQTQQQAPQTQTPQGNPLMDLLRLQQGGVTP